MNTTYETKGDVVVIKISGKLMGRLVTVILDEEINNQIYQGFKKIILNLSEVEYIDSTGLGALMVIKDKVIENKGHIIFADISNQVNDILTTTQMIDNFVISVNVEQALKQLEEKK